MNGALLIITAISACLITAIIGYILIPLLKRLKYGQTILEIGPKWHKSKEGVPTMGGFMFIIGVVASITVAFLIADFVGATSFLSEMSYSERLIPLVAGLGLALGMALIGFIDDYIKVVKKRNLGLSARQKTLMQLLIAAAYLVSLHFAGMNYTWLPFFGAINVTTGLGLLYWPIALIFIYGFVNAVNLTDGIDGLASSVTLVVAGFFMLLTIQLNLFGLNILSAALAGAMIGFLMWNMHPAKVFMGDTGSMFLGGLVVALAFGTGYPVLLLLVGIIYLVEALSVVIQVSYYKRTKKRIFKMSPIHHHYEMSGWSENKIVVIFSIVTMVGSAIAFLVFRFLV